MYFISTPNRKNSCCTNSGVSRLVRRVSTKEYTRVGSTTGLSIDCTGRCSRRDHSDVCHSFDCSPSEPPPFTWLAAISFLAHSAIPRASASISSSLLLECKQTRTRSKPLGTVGHVIDRAFMPFKRRYVERGRGRDVKTGTMGVARLLPKETAVRWGGRDSREGDMPSRSMRLRSVSMKRMLKSSNLVANWEIFVNRDTTQMHKVHTLSAIPFSRKSKEQSIAITFAWLSDVVYMSDRA